MNLELDVVKKLMEFDGLNTAFEISTKQMLKSKCF